MSVPPAPAPIDPDETLGLVARILDTHHALLRQELPRLGEALRGRDRALVGPFVELRALLEAHLWKEEVILFPAIQALARGEAGGGCGVEAPIRQMSFEHEKIRELEEVLRGAASLAGAEAGALVALLDDLAVHARTEDEALFPAALSLAASGVEVTPSEAPAEPPSTPRTMTLPPPIAVPDSPFSLRHLGWSGLELRHGGLRLSVDPPEPVEGPIALSWSEQERVRGARASRGPFAAAQPILSWLALHGMPLEEGRAVPFGGWMVSVKAYRPIPYATAPEAARKVLSGLRSPAVAAGRLAFTLRRPSALPLALRLDVHGRRAVLLGQALHRFLTPEEHRALVTWAGRADLVVAGTDYDDEAATGSLLAAFDAGERVIADLTGQVRRALHLPVRTLDHALAAAPTGTHGLSAGSGVGGPSAG